MSEDKEVVSERDKPFVLALISAGITIVSLAFAVIGAFLHNQEMTNTSVEALKFTFPLTAMAWTFYLKKE